MNMIRQSLVFILFLAMFAEGAKCQEHFIVKKDLQSEWLVYAQQSYVAFNDSQAVNTIYFSLNPKSYKGDYLELKSDSHFSVMLNGKLILDQEKIISLPIDSLSKLFSPSTLFFAIHQEQRIRPAKLTTHISSMARVNSPTGAGETFTLRSETFFHDFAITAVLMLFIFLISMIRLNPRLSSDYFSLTKIFSLRDNEDDQFYYRLTSGNILFYVFTSTVLAFYLFMIGQHIETGLGSVRMDGYLSSLLALLKISLIIFMFLFLKMLIVYTITSLFGVVDTAGFHFFNFIRLLLVFIGVLALALAVYYVLHGQQKGLYVFLYEVLTWILGGWVILLFLKLTNRVQYSVFHIFSYICATEIIPFLLIVKVLNE